jgi:hypothetical protein
MSESFSFDVDYSTTFKQIERLRSLMLGFVQMERRDFQPSFDVVVVGTCQCQRPKIASNIGLATKDIPDQQKMTLQADIMYKSNWQQGNLKSMCTPWTQNDLEGSHCSLLASSLSAQQVDLRAQVKPYGGQNLWSEGRPGRHTCSHTLYRCALGRGARKGHQEERWHSDAHHDA